MASAQTRARIETLGSSWLSPLASLKYGRRVLFRSLQGVDPEQEFHEVVVRGVGHALDDEHVPPPDRLLDTDEQVAFGETDHLRLADARAQLGGNRLPQPTAGRSGEDDVVVHGADDTSHRTPSTSTIGPHPPDWTLRIPGATRIPEAEVRMRERRIGPIELLQLLEDWSTGTGPLYRQLSDAMRRLIEVGDLRPGDRKSTRLNSSHNA